MFEPASLIMPGFRFGVHDPSEAERLVKAGVAGFCLYGGTAMETANFIIRLNKVAARPLLFAADFENGAGSQVSDAVELVSNLGIGVSADTDLARLKGEITAEQARCLGISMVLAPVVDLSLRADNPIVSIRSFGAKAEQVTSMAKAFIDGIHSRDVAVCLKHFPGHGDTKPDSHLDLAHLLRPLKKVMAEDILPYKRLCHAAEAVMTGHLVLETADKAPATLSRFWTHETLRKALAFDGLIITDALMMGAMLKHFSEDETVKRAVTAGADILLYPKDPWSAIKTLKTLLHAKETDVRSLEASAKRVLAARKKVRPLAAFDQQKFKEMESAHFDSALRLAKECAAWVSKPMEPKIKTAKILYHELVDEKPHVQDLTAILAVPQERRLSAGAKRRALEMTSLMHDQGGGSFLRHLLSGAGLDLIPFGRKMSADPDLSVIVSYHKPRAFSGKIGFSAKDERFIEKAVQANSRSPFLIISFGDPYHLMGLPAKVPALCLFSGSLASQTSLVDFLRGKLKIKNRF
ncbi:MAG: glycoside hydrolase family 3 N-terminal domain-containing protein [Elusimicrobiota bacterium]